MESKLYTLKETSDLILNGRVLVIAGDDKLLKQLPDGKWIGGFNPYVIDKDGGRYTTEQLLVKDFTDDAVNVSFKTYDETNIDKITADGYSNGIIVAIMPIHSNVHTEFALHAPTFENQYVNPLIGWVSGDTPENTVPGVATSYVGNKRYTDKAAVLHLELPENKIGRVEIISVYEADPNSDELTFDEDGFNNTTVNVNGEKMDLYEYFESINYIYSLPIMADYAGAKINISFIKDEKNKKALFCAPVYKGTVYKVVTNQTDDYQKEFLKAFGKDKDAEISYSYSCIYNYINFNLEGKTLANTSANFTWGEIAYHLLNITHVYLVIEDK